MVLHCLRPLLRADGVRYSKIFCGGGAPIHMRALLRGLGRAPPRSTVTGQEGPEAKAEGQKGRMVQALDPLYLHFIQSGGWA